MDETSSPPPPGGDDYSQLSHSEQSQILQLQQSLLAAVAGSHDARAIIDQLCRLEEQLVPNAVASVMLLNEQGILNVYTAPTIPTAGHLRLNGLRPGPGAGSCGNAVYRREPVFVSDTLTDPKWQELRQLAIDFDLKACWSMPIRAQEGNDILGSFALSSFEHRAPSPFQRALLEIGASIIGIVLQRERQQAALEANELRYRQMFEVNPAVKLLIDPEDGRIVDANSAAVDFYGYPKETLLAMRMTQINTLPAELVLAAMAGAKDETRLHHSFQHRIASGEIRDVEVYSGPVIEDGRTLLHTIVHDVTDRKRAERELRQQRDFINAVFDQVGSVILVIDRDGSVVRFNRAAELFSGYSFEEVRARPFFWERFLPPEQIPGVREVFASRFQHSAGSHYENHWVNRQGERRLFEWSNTLLPGDDGTPRYLVTIGNDITRRKQREEALRLAAGVFEHTQEGILVTDGEVNILDVNPAFTRITGYTKAEVLGRNPRLLQSGQNSEEHYRQMWESINTTGKWQGESWNQRKNGEVYPSWLNISAVRNDNDEVTNYVSVFTDISRIKQQERALERLAHYDALTGLPNRVLLADRMQQAMALTRRTDTLLAVAYLDLNGFKPVNDRYGHEAGDVVLAETAKRIATTLRGGDTVARLGGDEFVILLQKLHHMDECELALARIRQRISQPIPLPQSGVTVTISASIGVCLYFADDTDAETLLREADQAMYRAKHDEREDYRLYEQEGAISRHDLSH